MGKTIYTVDDRCRITLGSKLTEPGRQYRISTEGGIIVLYPITARDDTDVK